MQRENIKSVLGRLRLPLGAAEAAPRVKGFIRDGGDEAEPKAKAKAKVNHGCGSLYLPPGLVHKLAEFYGKTLEHVSSAQGHSKKITRMSLSPDGQRVATASYDKTVIVWRVGRDSEGWEHEATLAGGHDKGVLAVCWTPDGTRLVSGGLDCRVICWNATGPNAGAPAWVATGHTGTVWGIAVAPPAPAPAPVSSRGGRTGRRGHSTNTTPNTAAAGVVASTGISDGCIRLWDLADGAARRVIPAFQAGVDDVALHPDGAHCVAVGSDRETLFRGAIKVFDAQSGALVRRMRQLHGGLARSVVISDCGGFVLSSSDEATLNILVHDFRSGELLHALEGHSAHVRQLCVQGALLASVSHDRTVRVWRWREGTCAEVLSQLPESASACVQMDQSACGKARVRVGDGVCMGAGGRWIANTTTTTLPEERRAKVPKPPPVTIPGAGAAGASPPPSPPELVATDSEASSLASPSSFLDDEHSPSRAQRGADRRAASDADLYYDAYDTEDSSDGEEEDDDADLSADETELFEVLGEKPRARRRSHSIIHGWARFSHHSL